MRGRTRGTTACCSATPSDRSTSTRGSISFMREAGALLLVTACASVAAEQFGADVSRVAGLAFRASTEAVDAFIALQAATKKVELEAALLDGALAGQQLAEAQRAAGNVPELEVANQSAAAEQAQVG